LSNFPTVLPGIWKISNAWTLLFNVGLKWPKNIDNKNRRKKRK
jgi:hypothetical protein